MAWYDIIDITNNSTVLSGTSQLIDGGVYSISMSYRWRYNGNIAQSLLVTNITYDITPPIIPLLYQPSGNTFYGPFVLPINFTIGEQAKSLSVQLTIINVCTSTRSSLNLWTLVIMTIYCYMTHIEILLFFAD